MATTEAQIYCQWCNSYHDASQITTRVKTRSDGKKRRVNKCFSCRDKIKEINKKLEK